MNNIKLIINLKNTYSVNSILYWISRLPLIRRFINDSIYQERTFKIIGIILNIFKNIFKIFVGKIIYIFFFISFISQEYNNPSKSFITIFVMLTLIGTIINTFMLNPTKDKYYAIKLMKMDSRVYALTDYFFNIVKQFVGIIIPIIVFGLINKINIFVLLLMPIFISCLKINTNALRLKMFKEKNILKDENTLKFYDYIILVILLVLTYSLPYFNILITELIFVILSLITIFIAIPATKYIIKYDNYYNLYNKLISVSILNDMGSITNPKIEYEAASRLIDDKHLIVSKKHGYAFFNDLFFKRHHKVLISHARNVSIFAGICFISMVVLIILFPEIKESICKNIVIYFSGSLILMYYINSGQRIANILFLNCDVAMLTYNFYKERKVLINNFMERLKRLVGINLISSLTISLAISIIFCLTSQEINIINTILLFVSINMMSFFFSVHNLVLYYLFQPFTKDASQKSIPYNIIKGVTYYICLLLIDCKLNIEIFSLVLIAFTILYIIISLILVKLFAPHTFKIHK